MSQQCAVCKENKEKLLNCGRCNSRMYCGTACQSKDWPTHKNDCKRRNYILKVDLNPRHITNPRITRTLSCPANASFEALHKAILVSFGWANTHLYDFEVLNHNDVRGHEHRLVKPDCLFKITDLSTLDDFQSKDSSTRESSKTKLFKVLEDPVTKGKTIHYNYDFGDGWQHVISYTGRSDVTQHVVCVDGEGHGAAEDVGGWHGWSNLLAAYDASDPTQDQKDNMKWFEKSASNKDSAGLRGDLKWKWDKDAINKILSEFEGPSKPKPGSLDKPHVLMISLDRQSFFDNMFSKDLARLRSVSTLVEVTDIASALHHLEKEPSYTAVIVSDAGILEKKFESVQKALVEYTKEGGTVVLGLMIGSFSRPSDLKKFFKTRWNLPWTSGDYCRETFRFNPQVHPDFHLQRSPRLPAAYSMKALHLSNTRLQDRVYISNLVGDDSPAVFAKYGGGFLGWIGDVNGESESTELLLSMCDLAIDRRIRLPEGH